MGARVLYALLDDYAGSKGVCWPKQQTLAHRIGATRQRVNAWMACLERLGWISSESTGRAKRYTLKWAMATPERHTCGQRNSVYQPVDIEHAGVGVDRHAVQTNPKCASQAVVQAGSTPGWKPGDRGFKSHSLEESGADCYAYPDTPASCPHCHGAGEREYRIPAGRDSLGRPTPERRWRGKCGCR